MNPFVSKELGSADWSRGISTTMPFLATWPVLKPSAPRYSITGFARSGDAVSDIGCHGIVLQRLPSVGFPDPRSCTLIRMYASTPLTQGRSRMRENRSYGSVRGAPGNRRPYRDRVAA